MPKSPEAAVPNFLVLVAGTAALLLVSHPARAYGYVFSTFTGDDAAGEKLSIYTSTDALHFTLLSNTEFSGPSGTLRDPSIMKHVDGKYYVAYTDPLTVSCCGKEDHFSIASSTDLIHWTNLTMVNAGVPGVAHTWAPEWFVEGGTVNVIANIDTLNTDSDFKPYIFTARDSTLTSWSGPVPLGFGPNYIDTFVLKVGTTYHAFSKNETTRYCEHAIATKLTGPWTFVGTGNWAGWGSGMEGPAVTQLDDGTWRIFLDGQGSVPFVTATSPDLNTWSGITALPDVGNLVRHGTVIRDVATGGAPVDGGTTPDAGDDGAPSGPGDATLDGDATNNPGGDSGEGGAKRDAETANGDGDEAEADADADAAANHGEPSATDGGSATTASSGDAGGSNGDTPTHGGCSCDLGESRSRPKGSAALFVLIALATRLRRRTSAPTRA
jgi:Glycosyl hydrolases family 43